MTERLTLLDLSRKRAVVKVGTDEIVVRGLTGRALQEIMGDYDTFQKFLVSLTISNQEALRTAPDICAAINARGTERPSGMNIKQWEAVASELPAQDQLTIMLAIWGLTFTEGFGPFASAMRKLAEVASVVAGKAQDTKSGKPLRAMNPNTQDAPPDRASTSRPANSRRGTSTPPGEKSPERVN